MKYLNVLYVVFFTVYGQLIIKWRMSFHELSSSNNIIVKALSVSAIMLRDPYILSGIISAFLASLVWMNIIKNLQLNIAYPVMSLSFLLVFLFSVIFFHEQATWIQVVGLILIMIGVSFIGFSAVK